ncbi:MAG: hypothetical protein O7D93_03150 [Acidobacteria bacterium]|nr:hypothetical protein [Acidobacteriota bacterium]MCZ6879005.1 hypothetical protein [Acidobacteriota bacterium]
MNPLAYEVLIAHQDQPSKDIGDNAECVALVIQKSQEWQQDLRLARGEGFLKG